MAKEAQTARPFKLRHIPDDVWENLEEAERRRLVNGATPTPKITTDASGKTTFVVPPLDSKLTPLTDIRQWHEEVNGISGERLRNCIIYQLDVRKRDFWIKNMVPAMIRRLAKELDDETPPGWTPPEANPLIAEKKLPDGETKITIITRELATDAERKTVRDRFGITSYTIPKLAKKDCVKCKGTGYYNLPTYPDHPVFKKYEDTVTCECVSE
jgi:hypothetical protein